MTKCCRVKVPSATTNALRFGTEAGGRRQVDHFKSRSSCLANDSGSLGLFRALGI